MARSAIARLCLAWVGGLLLASPAGANRVDFDDRTGRSVADLTGPCGSSFEVDDEYLSLGVRFASNDPVVCVLAAGDPIAPSPPNVATGITGGDIDFDAPVFVTFFEGGSPASVSVARLTLTDSSDFSVTVEAYDEGGTLLGSSGKTGPGEHLLVFPRLIHELRVEGGNFALDDVGFSPPGDDVVVPALPGAAPALLAALLAATGARRSAGR